MYFSFIVDHQSTAPEYLRPLLAALSFHIQEFIALSRKHREDNPRDLLAPVSQKDGVICYMLTYVIHMLEYVEIMLMLCCLVCIQPSKCMIRRDRRRIRLVCLLLVHFSFQSLWIV
jgi:hypothetical protein